MTCIRTKSLKGIRPTSIQWRTSEGKTTTVAYSLHIYTVTCTEEWWSQELYYPHIYVITYIIQKEKTKKKETLNSICFISIQWRAPGGRRQEVYFPHIYVITYIIINKKKKETLNSICFIFMQWRASEEETTEQYSPYIDNDVHQMEETANSICPIYTMTYIRRTKHVRPTSMQWRA